MKTNLFLAFFFLASHFFGQNVSLDLTFGTNGKVISSVSPLSHYASDIGFTTSGKFLTMCSPVIGEYAPLVARYNNDGSIDTAFGVNGVLSIGNGIELSGSLIVLADDSFLVSGSKEELSGLYTSIVLKYNPNGSLDTTYGINGIATVKEFGYRSRPVMALDANGKIVVAGKQYNALDDAHFWVKRFNANGTLDTVFAGSGELTIDFGADDSPHGITFQSDQKIIIAGDTEVPSAQDNSHFIMTRLNTNGTLDTTFGANGLVITDFNGNDIALGVTVLSNDAIVLTGTSSYNFDINHKIAIAKYTTSGVLDATFGNGGKLLSVIDPVNQRDAVFKIVEKDNKLYGIGFTQSSGFNYLLVRYNLDGSFDTTLNQQGYIITDFNNSYDKGYNGKLQPDGKLICMGYTSFGTIAIPSMLRFEFSGLSSDESLQNNDFSVYPNPFTDSLTIASNTNNIQNFEVQVFDNLGRKVSTTMERESGKLYITLDNDIGKGCYFLKISSFEKSQVFKILK